MNFPDEKDFLVDCTQVFPRATKGTLGAALPMRQVEHGRIKEIKAMQVFIYREWEFNKRVNQLHKAGGKAAQAARRVERIIQQLVGCDPMKPEEAAKLTRYGEARIDKCRKLDLGSGYRLIYLKDRSIYVFLFVGTHDECDRWLKRNVGFEALTGESKCEPIPEAKEVQQELKTLESSAWVESDDHNTLEEELDDRTLRRIFCGLSGEKAQKFQKNSL